MDPNNMDSSVLSDLALAALQQQQLQQLQQQQQLQQLQQQQQLIAGGNRPAPLDVGSSGHLHGNSLSLGVGGGLPAGLQSPDVMGIVPGVTLASRLQGQGAGVTGELPSATAAQMGITLQRGAELTGPRGPRGIKRMREKPHGQEYYYRQWRRLKKTVKDFIFLNSSVCDEVIRVEEKLARVKEERRYLLRKLLQFQSVTEGTAPLGVPDPHAPPSGVKVAKSPASSDHTPEPSSAKKAVSKKKAATTAGGSAAGGGGGGGDTKKKMQSQTAKDLLESLQSKPKKSKSQSNRKTIPSMMLDSLGRPVFPMMLGDLTLHSIGEIVPDRSSFNSHECIYPAGFCSTRVFAGLTNPQDKCLYTCKISDCGDIPEFEIAPEEGTEQVFRGSTPNECHIQLLQAINAAVGADLLPVSGRGEDFFGLTNPVIQNLIQSCPGAKKCSGYKWIRFEINKAESNENVAVGKTEPTISVDAFHRFLQQAGVSKLAAFSPPTEHATNLRSLLTKGSVPFAAQK